VAKLPELLQKPYSDEFVSGCLISPIVGVPRQHKAEKCNEEGHSVLKARRERHRVFKI
jgi:hypothetical protein